MRQRRAGSVSVLFVAVQAAAWGCSDDPVQPALESGLVTDAAVFALAGPAQERVVRVGFTFRNASDEAIYFPNCDGRIDVVLEAESQGRWVVVADPGSNDCLGPPVVADAGGSVRGSFSASVRPPGAFLESDFAEGFEPPGTYRLRILDAVFDYDPGAPGFGTPVDSTLLVSNTFEIRP